MRCYENKVQNTEKITLTKAGSVCGSEGGNSLWATIAGIALCVTRENWDLREDWQRSLFL